ncbi:SCP-like extracellular protein [Bacillus lacus]|uniref:SCP-like extracellular protein n=2 Tax=Metabacillus lacus TaxID=1983721 RepID=A0A7X2IXY3_9BACI|nr:SCP-like extracellular protein [Metabacillus lacus]
MNERGTNNQTGNPGVTNLSGGNQYGYQGNGNQGGNGTTANENQGNTNQQNLSTADIQRVSHGYITIDPNSFSTTIPSKNFPHTALIQDGGRHVFEYGGRAEQQQGTGQQGAQPDNATPAPQGNEGQQGQTQQAQNQQEANGNISDFESKVIELTNAERAKEGLPKLQADEEVSNVAQEKSNDMQQNQYFSHNSPTFGSPFDMMRDFGVTYKTAGENIAMGQRSPEEVVQAWMDSEGHRKNIMNGDFTHIGVGHTEEGNYWTQMFIGK